MPQELTAYCHITDTQHDIKSISYCSYLTEKDKCNWRIKFFPEEELKNCPVISSLGRKIKQQKDRTYQDINLHIVEVTQ